MKYVERVKTFDGVVHLNERDARKYLDVRYTNLMSNFATRLVQQTNGKYIATKDFLDSHLDELIEMKKIKDDMVMEGADND